eukprot:TRINITY_DN68371_c0_g1_i1.p1 TRINITY_DN68371_c0_g1~~TRINITY_DN68371_c0_g1_i1.p1  ORF type:complete len:847 (-),score=148.59 TRINITY_DN68371_c0_g1_i1:149-2350(-)
MSEDITFMSNGTETINHALFGLADVLAPKNSVSGQSLPRIITQQSEHVAVLETVRALEQQGRVHATYLPVGPDGVVCLDDLKSNLPSGGNEAIVLSIMHSNNETGALQPIKELAACVRTWTKESDGRRSYVHCDASQSLGKLHVDVNDLGVDLLTIAGHKLYAPKGIGALYARKTVPALPQYIHGAGQEMGRRASTENVIQVVGLGKACEIAKRDLEKNEAHMRRMRDRLHAGIDRELKQLRGVDTTSALVRVNGPTEARLPNTLSLSFRKVEANTLLSLIGDEVAASAGAACHSDSVQMSHVLTAMAVTEDWGMGTVRLTVGKGSEAEEMDRAASVIARGVSELLPQDVSLGDMQIQPAGEASGPVKLTRYTHGMGCACKLRPQALEQVLRNLQAAMGPVDPEKAKKVLVGLSENNDDACVYQITDELAIVATTDFFTPVVDDPETFGKIAAANALSDIYAMGAKPLFALNIVGFPSHRLQMSVLEDILKGGQAKCTEAGIQILGGHSVDDTEPKYGLAVIGVVHPKRFWRNNSLRQGDVLVLTKPLGTGILSTALKRGAVSKEAIRALEESMTSLNKNAAECAAEFGDAISGVTDVTGFGFLGHLREMLTVDAGEDPTSGIAVVVWASAVPVLPQVDELSSLGEAFMPGGSVQNLKMVEAKSVTFADAVQTSRRFVLADAQSSGGLLLGVRRNQADALLSRLRACSGCEGSAIVGETVALEIGSPIVRVVP